MKCNHLNTFEQTFILLTRSSESGSINQEKGLTSQHEWYVPPLNLRLPHCHNDPFSPHVTLLPYLPKVLGHLKLLTILVPKSFYFLLMCLRYYLSVFAVKRVDYFFAYPQKSVVMMLTYRTTNTNP